MNMDELNLFLEGVEGMEELLNIEFKPNEDLDGDCLFREDQ